jgi:uncharacterized protein YbjT (DUF2867 family)
MSNALHSIFITGGTGYIGSRLIPRLVARGHNVTALVREQSRPKLPEGCTAVIGDALDSASYAERVRGHDTFIQLVGVSHPSPAKAREFQTIDLKAGMEAIRVAADVGIRHFIYVSVAHPAPAMHAYIAVRSACEDEIHAKALNATILRPWYVLGPGHWWPYMLLPLYKMAEHVPSLRDGALRLGLVTVAQMLVALQMGVAEPAEGVRVLEVPAIRKAHS